MSKHAMRAGVGSISVTTKRVKKEARRAAKWFQTFFPGAKVRLIAVLEDGTRIKIRRG